MKSLNIKGKFIYVYLPTRFGFSSKQINIKDRLKFYNLNVSDLYLLEQDYKRSLLEKLLDIDGIEIFNISSKAEEKWFVDESHYSAIEHEEIANILIGRFLTILN